MRRERRPLEPWAVAEAENPGTGGPEAGLHVCPGTRSSLLRGATRSPGASGSLPEPSSCKPTAPGRFSVVDPEDRALIINCGRRSPRCAPRHATPASPPPSRSYPTRATPTCWPESLWSPAIRAPRTRKRCCARSATGASNRQAFEARDVPDPLLERRLLDARAEGALLEFVRGAERAAIAELIAEGDRAQMADKRFCHELASWNHPNHSRSHDGMRVRIRRVDVARGSVRDPLLRPGTGQAERNRELAERSPVLAVFGTASDRPAAWLATRAGVAAGLSRAPAARRVDLVSHPADRGGRAQAGNCRVDRPARRALATARAAGVRAARSSPTCRAGRSSTCSARERPVRDEPWRASAG